MNCEGELRFSPHEYGLGAEYEISRRSGVKKRHGIIRKEGIRWRGEEPIRFYFNLCGSNERDCKSKR